MRGAHKRRQLPSSQRKMAINYDAKLVDPHVYQDMIVTYNTCNTISALPELRAFQPGKPVIVTEMWTGPMVFWYKPVPGGMAPADVAQWVIEFTANQAMVNSYMFIGGTNFGFNAAANIATSYASDYPVGDGILPREKYYNMRPFGQFLDRFGGQVACSSYVDASMGAARACLHTAPMGEFLFAVSDEPMCQVHLGGETRVVRFGTVRGGVFGLGLKNRRFDPGLQRPVPAERAGQHRISVGQCRPKLCGQRGWTERAGGGFAAPGKDLAPGRPDAGHFG